MKSKNNVDEAPKKQDFSSHSNEVSDLIVIRKENEFEG